MRIISGKNSDKHQGNLKRLHMYTDKWLLVWNSNKCKVIRAAEDEGIPDTEHIPDSVKDLGTNVMLSIYVNCLMFASYED